MQRTRSIDLATNRQNDKMDNFPDCYGIIPARYRSSRFPGKPLAEILGKPMFWHVYQRAMRCQELKKVVLATEDERIARAAENLGVEVVMTADDHPSGSDRVLEAARLLEIPDDAIVINIQGDEPTLDPAMLRQVLRPFGSPEVGVATLARPLDPSEAHSPDRVTVALSKNGKGLYFSRARIPFPYRNANVRFYEHVGLYAFRLAMLQRFVDLGPSPLEEIESLEMLRLLENDIPICVEITDCPSVCVERPADITRAEEILSAHA